MSEILIDHLMPKCECAAAKKFFKNFSTFGYKNLFANSFYIFAMHHPWFAAFSDKTKSCQTKSSYLYLSRALYNIDRFKAVITGQ